MKDKISELYMQAVLDVENYEGTDEVFWQHLKTRRDTLAEILEMLK